MEQSKRDCVDTTKALTTQALTFHDLEAAGNETTAASNNVDAAFVSREQRGPEASREELSATLSLWRRALDVFKYAYSSALLLFCLVVVTTAIMTKQTTGTGIYGIHPGIAYPFFWFLILWLALMEGGLNCQVGLQPVNKLVYKDSHPKTFKCTSLAHNGGNIERFIIGRQFMDLLCVFMTSVMVSAISGASVLGLPSVVCDIFLSSGLAVILVTIVFGQLMTQINAAHSMLDFINNYAMIVVTYLALTIELSGLLHAVYLIQICFAKAAGKEIESREPRRTCLRSTFFWLRVTVSTFLLLASLVITGVALFSSNTTCWESLPAGAALVALIALFLITGFMEGLQIAFFSVFHLPTSERERHVVAKRNCDYVFKGQNLQTFLIGRQILQTAVMFLIARIANLAPNNPLLDGVPGLQKFANTGLISAYFATLLGSLVWRVIAATFPLIFLNSPVAAIIIKVCIWVENSGICHCGWIVAAAQSKLFGYRKDTMYFEKHEASKGESDSTEEGNSSTLEGSDSTPSSADDNSAH